MSTMLMQDAADEAVGGDPPVLVDKPKRRSFTAGYKLRIVADYDACGGDGDKSALLRRGGLYSSHIVGWRRARDAAASSGMPGPRRSETNRDGLVLENAKKRIEALEDDLAEHHLTLEIEGKAHAFLVMFAESETNEPVPTRDSRRNLGSDRVCFVDLATNVFGCRTVTAS